MQPEPRNHTSACVCLQWIGQQTRLESLVLERVAELPQQLCQLAALTRLDFRGELWGSQMDLPDDITRLTKLRELSKQG